MAVGGMIGGGVFSIIGVVVGIAGAWACLSFVVAGHYSGHNCLADRIWYHGWL